MAEGLRCLADDIFIIGYSFGDAHINSSIKTVLKSNYNVKLHFIDPSYNEKDGKQGYKLLRERMIYIFPELLTQQFKYENVDKNICRYFNGKLTVFAISYNEFLNN